MRSSRLSARSASVARVLRVEAGKAEADDDRLVVEEPLEIQLVWEGERKTVAVTMRTPGADAELAAGFLFAEGVVASPDEIAGIRSIGEPSAQGCPNVVEVELTSGLPEPQLGSLDRHFFSNSACGVCGKAALEGLELRVTEPLPAGPKIEASVLALLPERLRAGQALFASTGGLHAAGLFTPAGELLAVREDIGRHNALDKLIGWAFERRLLPLHGAALLVSGRTSYEILQKSLAAGIPWVCAVSAPSSLAVELARRFGITLVGFLRGDRCNVYHGAERIGGLEGRGGTRAAAGEGASPPSSASPRDRDSD
jgi:FdhD protein